MIERRATLLSVLASVALIVAPSWSPPNIRFIWNASASVPVGLYRIVPGNHVDVTDLAVVMPPAELAAFLDERRLRRRGETVLGDGDPVGVGDGCDDRHSPGRASEPLLHERSARDGSARSDSTGSCVR